MPSTPVRIVNLGKLSDPVRIDGSSMPLRFGGEDDYTEIAIDGTVQAFGDATCFRDELQMLSATRLTSPAGDFVLNDAECSVTAKISARYPADFCVMSVQLNHDWKLGSPVFPHLHWWQTTTNTPNWLLGYRWQKQGSAKTTAWSNLKWASNAFVWSAGTLNQISSFGAITPPVGYGQVSDILQLRIYRDYTNVSTLFGGGDPVNAAQDMVNLDVHIEVDMLGSHEEYIK